MIEELDIANLRGIRAGRLEALAPLTVLVGPNGCGKSTVLDALYIAAHPVPGDAVGHAVRRRSQVPQGGRWLIRRAGREGAAEVGIRRDDGRSGQTVVSVQEHTPGKKTQLKAATILRGHDGEKQNGLDTHITFGHDNTFKNLSAHDLRNALSEVRFVEPSAAAHRLRPLHELYSRVAEQGGRRAVQSLVTRVVPDLESVEILTDGDQPVLHLVYPDRSVPAGASGDGVAGLLRIAMELAARPDGLVLFEEPEVHQHPAALRQTATAIAEAVRRDVQVVLTTHDLELIDDLVDALGDEALDRLGVFRLALHEGELRSSHVAGPDVALSRREIDEDLR